MTRYFFNGEYHTEVRAWHFYNDWLLQPNGEHCSHCGVPFDKDNRQAYVSDVTAAIFCSSPCLDADLLN